MKKKNSQGKWIWIWSTKYVSVRMIQLFDSHCLLFGTQGNPLFYLVGQHCGFGFGALSARRMIPVSVTCGCDNEKGQWMEGRSCSSVRSGGTLELQGHHQKLQ